MALQKNTATATTASKPQAVPAATPAPTNGEAKKRGRKPGSTTGPVSHFSNPQKAAMIRHARVIDASPGDLTIGALARALAADPAFADDPSLVEGVRGLGRVRSQYARAAKSYLKEIEAGNPKFKGKDPLPELSRKKGPRTDYGDLE